MVDRIQILLQKKKLTPSHFADEIGVQRSAMSHILSGRNKPSLDFIQKILRRFPDINSEWLLSGKGEMMTGALDLFSQVEQKSAINQPQNSELFTENNTVNPEATDLSKQFETVSRKLSRQVARIKEPEKESIQHTSPETQPAITERKRTAMVKKIERIVIFYSDKSFDEYTPG